MDNNLIGVRRPPPASANRIAWYVKLGFWISWTLANAAGGAIGLLAGDCIIRWKLLGTFSTFAGLALFEGIIIVAKSAVFRGFKEMRYVRGLDLFFWLLAGAISFVPSTGTQSEGITSLSLDLLRFSGWMAIAGTLALQIPRFVNPDANRRMRQRLARLREYFEERLLLKPFYFPLLIVGGILFYFLALVVSAVCIIGPLFLVVGPIEYLRSAFEGLPWPVNIIDFGAAGVGWVGCICGLFYLIPYPEGRKVWSYLAHLRASRKTGKPS